MEAQRKQMVELIRRRGVTHHRVLDAMLRVPRHELVPQDVRELAYYDGPLPIGEGQTISQPYIVAFMSEAADIQPGEKVLEVGTGSGYQAAVLAEIGAKVFTIEIVKSLGERAARDLKRLGYKNVTSKVGNGYLGWPSEAPFDAIVATAAPDEVPKALLEQLADNGRLVIPVGPTGGTQYLQIHTRRGKEVRVREAFPVRFVPMTGKPDSKTQAQP